MSIGGIDYLDGLPEGHESLDPNLGDIALLTADLRAHRPYYKLLRDYYDGKQEIKFAGEKLQTAFGEELAELVCNRIQPAVDALSDRLQVLGFSSADGATDQDAARIWAANDMDKGQGELHTEALTTGDGYLIVWPDLDGQPRIYVNSADSIAVIYDTEIPGKKRVAAKTWRRADRRWRLNLYYEDRLEKYVTRSAITGDDAPEDPNIYEPYSDPDDLAWPIRYDPAWGNIVPVFHFANNARTGQYGKSEVAPLISLQNRLNMTLANLAVAEEFQSYRQRWATGIQPVLDPETGKPVSPFQAGAGQLWIATAKEAAFGDFEAADLAMFGDTAEGHEVRIARTARIPLYHLLQSGAPESGEGLKTAEEPFVAKIRDRQKSFGPEHGRAMEHALRIAGKSNAQLRTIWQRAETRDDREFWEVAAIRREMGVSPQQILREYGYSDKEIEKFREEIAEHTQLMTGLAAQAFNQGVALDEAPAGEGDEDDEDAAA